MDYFKSRIKGNHGVPWLDTRSKRQKASDAYFEELQKLANEIDDVEALTTFISYMDPDDCLSGYDFILKRLKELKNYIVSDATIADKKSLLYSLLQIYYRLEYLSTDAALYDDCGATDEDFDEEYFDEAFEDDDYEDDDFEDEVYEDDATPKEVDEIFEYDNTANQDDTIVYEVPDFASDNYETDDMEWRMYYDDWDNRNEDEDSW